MSMPPVWDEEARPVMRNTGLWHRLVVEWEAWCDRTRFRYMVWCGYYTMKFEPLRCHKCDWWQLEERIVDRIDYTVCEVEVVCPKCQTQCGYWAYGDWEPQI